MSLDHDPATDLAGQKEEPEPVPVSPTPDMPMMRIAVAGTGGLARWIALAIDQETSHHVVFLSRRQQPELSEAYQVAVVNYNDSRSLQFALRGIDTVISTVTGSNQIALITAAVAVRVRRFAPAEFEGPPDLRPANDPLDRERSTARRLLASYQRQQRIQTTAFVCGILYERFQPGGLGNSLIGLSSGFSDEGDYIMNCRTMVAQLPVYNTRNERNVKICMTAAQDVGRFVTRALDLPHWPEEMRMCGHRILIQDLVRVVEALQGRRFFQTQEHDPASLRSALRLAEVQQNRKRQIRLHALVATTEGRYDFDHCDLNRRFADIAVTPFQNWFTAIWGACA